MDKSKIKLKMTANEVKGFVEDVLQHKRLVFDATMQFCKWLLVTAMSKDVATRNENKINLMRFGYFYDFCNALIARAYVHDDSKFSEAEMNAYINVTPLIREASNKYGYNSDQCRAEREKLGDALKHHYKENAHHPEHYEKGYSEMNLYDKIEMLMDWVAVAGQRRLSAIDVISDNCQRFGISEGKREEMIFTVQAIESNNFDGHIGMEEIFYKTLLVTVNDWIETNLRKFAENDPTICPQFAKTINCYSFF